MIISIKQNIYGNWNIYKSGKRFKEIGASDFDAKYIISKLEPYKTSLNRFSVPVDYNFNTLYE